MANDSMATTFNLRRPVDAARDHALGGKVAGAVTIVVYADYLCPYCRRLRRVLKRLRRVLGPRLQYVFRHFPNERAHPGAEFAAMVAEAAARQGRFWEVHDWLYDSEPPITRAHVLDFVRSLPLDMDRFEQDMRDEAVRQRVLEDVADGRGNGVSGTPTVFIDGIRYDGAWDFHSLLEAIERPVSARVQRSARAFASLPASGGLVLLAAAAAAIICANTALAPYYRSFVDATFSIGPAGYLFSLAVRDWCSEGLLALFFLLVGLEIRRELTVGALTDRRAAVLPLVAAVGGVIAPALIYLAMNSGPAAAGWAVPTATDVAFTLGIMALLGDRIPVELRVFVAALAVIDDVLSVMTLAIFFSHAFDVYWLLASGVAVVVLFTLNRWRVYIAWPYAVTAIALGLCLHSAGVHATLAGVLLAVFLPTRPAPAVALLLGQAATALEELEYAERDSNPEDTDVTRIHGGPIWEWAGRNLSAASERLLSPADRIERALAPWTTYLVLPLFAFTATGVSLGVDIASPEARRVILGVALGLAFGKPLGITLASLAAVKSRVAVVPEGIARRSFVGAACLCGIGDTVALLMADQAFPSTGEAAVAKVGVLIGSTMAAAIGTGVLVSTSRAQLVTPVTSEGSRSRIQ
jgi:NhaA family Na+:H+ antiporter